MYLEPFRKKSYFALGAVFFSFLAGCTFPRPPASQPVKLSAPTPKTAAVDEAEQLNRQVSQWISTAATKAKRQNKKLLIVYGERHNKDKCIYEETAVLQNAKKAGISDLCVESSQAGLMRLMSTRDSDNVNRIIFPVAQNMGYNLVPIDNPKLQSLFAKREDLMSRAAVTERDRYMINYINNLPNSAVVIVGSAHLVPYIKGQVSDKFVTLILSYTLDLKEKNEVEKAIAKNDDAAKLYYPKLELIYNSNKVKRISSYPNVQSESFSIANLQSIMTPALWSSFKSSFGYGQISADEMRAGRNNKDLQDVLDDYGTGKNYLGLLIEHKIFSFEKFKKLHKKAPQWRKLIQEKVIVEAIISRKIPASYFEKLTDNDIKNAIEEMRMMQAVMGNLSSPEDKKKFFKGPSIH